MHGAHPFDGPTRLWWGRFQERTPVRQDDVHTRNLFRPVDGNGDLDASQMFRANGLFDTNGRLEDGDRRSNRTALHEAMAQLAELLKALPDPKESTPADPGVPSGYTYLLQFVAHDMIDSVVGFDIVEGGVVPTQRNSRSRPLMLETLYGGGPDEVPHVFALDNLPATDEGFVPRVRLRLGPRRARPPGMTAARCPFRDLARGSTRPQDSEDAALASLPADRHLLTEAFVADPRNDSHSLIAQLTILLSLLHNEVVRDLRSRPAADAGEADGSTAREGGGRERAYREFLCARLAVTDIYRSIVFEDVLPRILDRRILERYRREKKPLLSEGDAIPLEFTFGAFRFGHAMVREKYKVNAAAEQETIFALELGSARNPREPINSRWMVDWQRFFFVPSEAEAVGGNFSRRLAPCYAAPLNTGSQFAAKVEGLDTTGLFDRDLLASCYAGVLSVRALAGKLAGVFGEDTVRPFETWRARIADWLNRRRDSALELEGSNELAGRPVEPLAEDPPLPFFVLFEALTGETVDANGASVPIRGRHLGPIGSIIVAETFYGAASGHPLAFDEALCSASLGQRLAAYERAFLPNDAQAPDRPEPPLALAGLIAEEVTSMPRLLAFLEKRGQFASA